MNKKQMNGFTLVELLAVIVILAIILVIAVPKVMNVISESKKATIESTAKMIAGTAEKKKVQNTILGNVEKIDCEDVAKINDVDYESCSIEFVGNTAKVTLVGSGKFEGLNVCDGTKVNSSVIEENCSFTPLTIDLYGGTSTAIYKSRYEANSKITLIEPTKEGYVFKGWDVSGIGSSIDDNILTIGTAATTVTAIWSKIINFSINNIVYQAEEGMTWGYWTTTKYNTGGYSVGVSENVYPNSIVKNVIDDENFTIVCRGVPGEALSDGGIKESYLIQEGIKYILITEVD